jgi:hypothetical protein
MSGESVEVARGFEIVPLQIRPNGQGAVREKVAAEYLGFSIRKIQYLRAELDGYRVGGTWWYRLKSMDAYIDQCMRKTWGGK